MRRERERDNSFAFFILSSLSSSPLDGDFSVIANAQQNNDNNSDNDRVLSEIMRHVQPSNFLFLSYKMSKELLVFFS